MLQRLLSDPLSMTAVQRVLLVLTMMLLFASLLPVPQLADALMLMAGFQALFNGGMALVLGQKLHDPTLTRWDEAAAFSLLHYGIRVVT